MQTRVRATVPPGERRDSMHMNLLRPLFANPKGAARFLLWRLGIKRYQDIIPLFMMKRYVPQNPIILEAGAHLGEDTARLVRFFNPEKLYAFEPVPELFKSLKNSTLSFAAVECFPYALADKSGNAKLHVSSGYHELSRRSRVPADGSSSLLRPTGHFEFCPTVEFNKEIEVAVTTVDDFAKQHNLNRIDFMWLDLQGMELKTLQGAEIVLKTVSSVYLEASTQELYEGAASYADIEQWMRSRGFVPKYVAIPKDGHGNALFIKA
jgi:FkbM family methyltransferase